MELKIVKPRIFFAKFDTPYHLAMTMLRFESEQDTPRFKDNKYSFEQYLDWYIKKFGNGHLDVCENNIGFNVPSGIIRHFIKIFPKKSWTEKEKLFIKELRSLLKQEGLTLRSNFSVIACYHTEKSITFKHELVHALFETNKEYRRKVYSLCNKIDANIKKQIFDYAINILGYHTFNTLGSPEFINELNAYVATAKSSKNLMGGSIKAVGKKVEKTIKDFKQLFEAYSRESDGK